MIHFNPQHIHMLLDLQLRTHLPFFPPGVTLQLCMNAHTFSINKMHALARWSMCTAFQDGLFSFCFDSGADDSGRGAAFRSERKEEATPMGPNNSFAGGWRRNGGGCYAMGGAGGGLKWVWELSASGEVLIRRSINFLTLITCQVVFIFCGFRSLVRLSSRTKVVHFLFIIFQIKTFGFFFFFYLTSTSDQFIKFKESVKRIYV